MTITAAPGSAGPLVVRIRNWVGDVVLGLPALELLESHGYRLHIIARGRWAPALLSGYGWPVDVQPSRLGEKLTQLRDIRRRCNAIDAGFDKRENAFVLPESFSSALEMRLAGLKAVGWAREGRSPLLKRAEPIRSGSHALIHYWRLACRFLDLEQEVPQQIHFRVSPVAVQRAEQLLAEQGIAGRYFLVCPFAGGLATAKKLNKKWPEFARFVATAEQTLGLPMVVYPGPGESAQAREMYPAARLIDGADMAIYAALLKRAALVIANDTGPGHVAAALGTPLLSVFGPTIVEQWVPWGPSVTVLQHPQPDDATVWPTVEEVVAAAQKKLGA